LDDSIHAIVSEPVKGSRTVLSATIGAGIAAPCFTASISYFDNFINKRMPSNLIQSQRDYFGAHTYELIGKEGVFHTQWAEQ